MSWWFLPFLTPGLWPRPERRERLHVFINRPREKGKEKETNRWLKPHGTARNKLILWQHSNPPHPPPPRVPLCLMSQPFTKDCNWRRSIGGRGQEQSHRDFQKAHAGSQEEMVLPPNSQLHVITIIQPWKMVYSILLWGSSFHVSRGKERGGAAWSDRDYVKQILSPSTECCLFFPLCPPGVDPMDNYLFLMIWLVTFRHMLNTTCPLPLSTTNVKAQKMSTNCLELCNYSCRNFYKINNINYFLKIS